MISSFQAEGTKCTNFKIDSRHLKLHITLNLYKNQYKSDETE